MAQHINAHTTSLQTPLTILLENKCSRFHIILNKPVEYARLDNWMYLKIVSIGIIHYCCVACGSDGIE